MSIVFDLERTNQLSLLPDNDLVDLCPPIEPYQVTKNRYHFVLKSGCRLEKLQLETGRRIEMALATYSIVAWRLLWLTYQACLHGEESCESFLEEHEWQSLCATIHKKSLPSEKPLSLARSGQNDCFS